MSRTRRHPLRQAYCHGRQDVDMVADWSLPSKSQSKRALVEIRKSRNRFLNGSLLSFQHPFLYSEEKSKALFGLRHGSSYSTNSPLASQSDTFSSCRSHTHAGL